MATVKLTQPLSGKVLEVSEEGADFWRSLGYADAKPKRARKAPAEEAEAKEAESDG